MRLVVVLGDVVHVRNFLGSRCLEMLSARGHVLTLVAPVVALAAIEAEMADWPSPAMLTALEPAPRWHRLLRSWAHLASFVHRRRFRTYAHKLRMGVRWPRGTNRKPYRVWTRYCVQTTVARLMERCGVDLEAFWRGVEARMPLDRRAVALLEILNPDLLLAVTSIHDDVDVELVKAAKARNVPVVAFAGSWDNLTSKGMFYVEPDHLLVWGEENRKQAIEHHGFRPEQITVTGAPHFDVYGTRGRP